MSNLQLPLSITYHSLQVPNPSVAALYEDALVYETGSAITSSGALTAYSGAKTGRSPLDKRIVKEPSSENEIWWGPVNKAMTPEVRHFFRRMITFIFYSYQTLLSASHRGCTQLTHVSIPFPSNFANASCQHFSCSCRGCALPRVLSTECLTASHAQLPHMHITCQSRVT
jgi:hypothetical protein